MIHDPGIYLAAAGAVMLIGLSKGGLVGAALLAMPLMTLVMPPLQAGAILLPVLLVQDALTVSAFRKTWDRTSLRWAIPGGFAGVLIGYLISASVTSSSVELTVGAITTLFALLRIIRPGSAGDGDRARPVMGCLAGLASGFTAQIAHAGGPPFQMYLLQRRLPTEMFLGTAAIFFTSLDLAKIPAFLALGQLRPAELIVSATIIPLAVVSNWIGIQVTRRLPVERLYKLITGMLLVVGSVLMIRAIA